MSAFKSAQERQTSGHLVEASQLYSTCADTACGAPLWQECATRNTELRSALPSVVPLVTDEAGEPRIDVQVKMDGEPFTSRPDGRGMPVNPGTHEFSFATDSGVFATAKVTIEKGQRNRPIWVSLRAPSSSTAHK